MAATSRWTKHTVALIGKQHGRCYYCGEELRYERFTKNDPQYASIDHVIPRAANGGNNISNLVVCCRLCNVVKDNMPVDVFISILDLNDVKFNKILQKRKNKRIIADNKKARKSARKRRAGLIKRFMFLWRFFPELAQEVKDAIDADPEGAYDVLAGGRRLKARANKMPYEIKLKECRRRRIKNKDMLPENLIA